MKTKITILLCLALLPTWMYAQNPWIDSLKNASLTQKDDTSKVWTLRTIASYYVFNDPDSAIVYAKRALAISEEFYYDKGAFWSIQTLHNAFHVTSNYTEELNCALKALSISKGLNDPYAYGWSNGMMADSYINHGDYTSAMKYIKIVMKNIHDHFPNELFSGYAAIVPDYIGLHEYDSAMYAARKGLELLQKQPALYEGPGIDGKYAKNQVFLSLAKAFEATALYDSALYFYNKSIPIGIEIGVKICVLDAYNGKANVFREQHELDSAFWYANKVLADKLTQSYPRAKITAANLLADVYEQKDVADSSLKYLRIVDALEDSIYSRTKTFAFQNALLKDQEQQKEIQTATAALENRYRLYFLGGLFVSLIIITGIASRIWRIRQLQSIRNNIADDLHDDIGSTLSSISIMSELAKEKSPEALPLLNSISDSTSAIHENMSDIVWAVNPNHDHFESVVQRMRLFATEILDAKNILLEFDSDALLNTTRLTMKQRKNLYLFFKEAVNNAAKHSSAKKILVVVTKDGGSIEMNISDDGSGFNTAATFSGNGMSSLKKRADDLNAEYHIKSQLNEGTMVRLKFRIN